MYHKDHMKCNVGTNVTRDAEGYYPEIRVEGLRKLTYGDL
jgi:hypothetical protein